MKKRHPSFGPCVLEALKGRWSLKRSMGLQGSFQGEASFVPNVGGLLYREEGTVTPPVKNGSRAESFFAYREYFYSLKGESLTIDFRDPSRWGARYITLKFYQKGESLWARDLHLCSEDLYRHFFCFQGHEAFRTLVCVSGPKKSYVLKSRYGRL